MCVITIFFTEWVMLDHIIAAAVQQQHH